MRHAGRHRSPSRYARPVSSRRGLTADVSIVFLCRFVGMVLNAVVYVLVARAMGPAGFGRFAAVAGIVTVAQVLLDAGTSSVVSRDAAEGRERSSLTAALVYRGWLLALLVLGLLGLLVAGSWGPPSVRPATAVVAAAAVWTVSGVLQVLAVGLLIGRGRTLAGSVLPLAERVLAVVVILLVLLADRLSVTSTLAAVAGSCLATAVVAGVTLRADVLAGWAGRARARGSALGAAPSFLTSSLGAQLQNLDVPLVGALAGAGSAGLLAAPSRLTTPLGLVAASAASILLVQARHHAGGPRPAGARPLRRVVAGVLALTALGALPLLVVPERTARLLLGEGYSGSATVFRLVAVGVCVAAVNQPLAAQLQAMRRHREVAMIVLAGGLLGLVVVAVTAPAAGATGGGVGILGSQLVILLALGLALRRHGVVA
ncbi:MAG: hypothetical protein QOI54_3139 [Actinomycetota bacterium]|nr:hypothetical protein [Actinomycetota bacterium]